MKLLFDSQTENGSSSSLSFIPSVYNFGKGAVIAFGTWDTATMTLEFSPDGTNWYAVGSDTTFTADGWSNFEMNGSVDLRATLSSVGENTDLSFGIL